VHQVGDQTKEGNNLK